MAQTNKTTGGLEVAKSTSDRQPRLPLSIQNGCAFLLISILDKHRIVDTSSRLCRGASFFKGVKNEKLLDGLKDCDSNCRFAS